MMLTGSCKSKANATKSFKILHAPPILTLHLKRFSVSYSSYGKPRANKNTQFVEYPESLDIAPYMVDPKVSPNQIRSFGVTLMISRQILHTAYSGSHVIEVPNSDSDITHLTSEVLRELGSTPMMRT